MRQRRQLIIPLMLIIFGVQGCGYSRHITRKPWGTGTWVPALVCGGIGAGTGWIIQNNRPGTSTVTIRDSENNVINQASVTDNKEQWKGAAIGGAIGVVLCGLVGHALLDPEPEPVLPIPPLPPPLPTPEAAPAPVKKRIVLRGVNFDFDKSDLRADSQPVLDEAAETLRENPGIRVSVEGHTDSLGTEPYNLRLSDHRANAVYRYLVASGIAPERMGVVGFGESRPVADNATESGRAQNRRVELRIEEGAE